MQCKGTCSLAEQSRRVWCAGLSNDLLDDSKCNSTNRPIVSQPCDLEGCGPRWQTYEWSEVRVLLYLNMCVQLSL